MKAQTKVFAIIGAVLLFMILSLSTCLIYSRIISASPREKRGDVLKKNPEPIGTTKDTKPSDEPQGPTKSDNSISLDHDHDSTSTIVDDEDIESINDDDIVRSPLQTTSNTELPQSFELDNDPPVISGNKSSSSSGNISPVSKGTNGSISTIKLEKLLLKNGFLLKSIDYNINFEESVYSDYQDEVAANDDYVINDTVIYELSENITGDDIKSFEASPVTVETDQSNGSFVKL